MTVTTELSSQVLAQPSLELARAAARELVRNPDVADALAVLIRWTPRRHTREDLFQSSFRREATRNGYEGQIDEKMRLRWGTEGGDPSQLAIPDVSVYRGPFR